MSKIGLVLEGGGMRGLYTAGVLDLLLDKKIDFDYVIGVSAGVCNGVSYISGQCGRSRRININYAGDSRYLSARNMFRTGSLFGMDFVFDEIPNTLDPFDFDAFEASKKEFVAGVTDVKTGRPFYFSHLKRDYINIVARASSAIPVFSPIVEIDGGQYLDGGTSDPIPVRKALEDGCDKVVVVLTRNRDYVKPPERFKRAYSRIYKAYPEMATALDRRHEIYNETLRLLRALEKEKKAIVLAPELPITISRFEKGKDKLQALYDEGYVETQKKEDEIKAIFR